MISREHRAVAVLILCVLVMMVLYYNYRAGQVAGLSLVEARHYRAIEGGSLQCLVCFRLCVIRPGDRGFCGTRENRGGTLYTLVYGQAGALQVDPIEKEPLYHVLPGSRILGMGTASCNFRCSFCHNWSLTQRLPEQITSRPLTPEELIGLALERDIDIISFTYNEPTIHYEFIYDVARLAGEHGVRVMFHTNGSMNPELLEELLPHVMAVTVDLKAFTADFYQDVSFSDIGPVLDTLKVLSGWDGWVEVVNLIIPGLNDDMDDVQDLSRWLLDLFGPDIPLHFNRFIPAYRLSSLEPTPVATLEEARRIARDLGLNHVYIGNVPGHPANSTYCPVTGQPVILRQHFAVVENQLGQDGTCPHCGGIIPGLWSRHGDR